MTKVPWNKRAGKLNRGEYLVIRLGDQFFAGYQIIATSVKASDAQIPKKPKGGEPYYFWWKWENAIIKPKAPRFATKRSTVVVKQKREPQLASTLAAAKQFRRLNQAEEACEILNRHYHGIVKATIEYHGE